MLKTNSAQKGIAVLLVLGIPMLLFLAAHYSILSSREFAIAVCSWLAIALLCGIVLSFFVKRPHESVLEPSISLDDYARKRILLSIRLRKIWVGLLVGSLLYGIVVCVARRAWLPILVVGAVSLLLIYTALLRINLDRKRLGSTRADSSPSTPA